MSDTLFWPKQDIEFPVALKKEHVEIQSVSLKEVKFPWVLVFYLKISMGWHTITQLWTFSSGENLVVKKLVVKTSKGKAANLKSPVLFRKRYPQPPPAPLPNLIFSGITHLQKNHQEHVKLIFFLNYYRKNSSYPVIFPFKDLFLRLLMFSYHQLKVATFPCNHTFQFMLMDITKLTGCPLILTHILQEYFP